MHGALHALHVSQQRLCVVCKNCPQVIEKEQWQPNNSPDLNAMKITMSGSDAPSYLETFLRSKAHNIF